MAANRNVLLACLIAAGVGGGNAGLPKKPWTQANAMVASMNTGSDTYYAARRYCNVVLDMDFWQAVTATGAARTGTTFVPSYSYTGAAGTWSQYQGTLYGDGDGSGTDAKYFRATIASTAYGLPSGTYTVLNPCGVEFAIGTFSAPTALSGWSTAKYFTFNYTAGPAGMMLWFRGKNFANTGAGNVQIVRSGGAGGSLLGDGTIDTVNGVIATPGTYGYTAGNPWNPDFLAFHVGLKTQHLRWMASNAINGDPSQDWADRMQPTSMAYVSQYLIGHIVPYELQVDFANRTGIDPWTVCPSQVTTDYLNQWANVFKGLNTNRRVLPEYCNETWNFGGIFGVGANYVAFAQYTKHYATPSDVSAPAFPVFLCTAHGRSVGDTLEFFQTRENAYLPAMGVPTYYMGGSYSAQISAVPDADHFTLNLSAGGHTIPNGLVNIRFCWTAEPGFSSTQVQADHNHAALQAAVWDAFDAALGASRVVHSMGSQAADSSHTNNRLAANPAITARTEFVHVAPYYNGLYWIASMNGTSGSITPHVWNSLAGTAWWGLYANGSTPTPLDVVKQQGTGFIGGGGTGGTALSANSGANPAPSLPAVSGLTDGTNYSAFIVFQETATGSIWMIGTGTDAQNATSVLSTNAAVGYLYDTYANQAARGRQSTISAANYTAHMAAITGNGSTAGLISYEGGPDMNNWTVSSSSLTQTQLQQWILRYLTDTTAVSALQHNYNHLARVGYKNHTYFLDVQGGGQYSVTGGSGVYDFINNQDFSNTADPRYQMLVAYNGVIPQQTAIPSSMSNSVTATAITSAPSYPYTAYTLPAGYTYRILSGDWTNNFSISGLNVVMNNGVGVNFSQFAPRVLTIEAADAYSSVFFQLTIPVGSGWWEGDAVFLWDSVGAPAGTSMTPPTNPPFTNFGSPLTEVAGTGNPPITSSSGTVTNDLWKMATYVFANASGATTTIPCNVPFLVAHLVDIGDETSTFEYAIGVGAGSNSISWGVGSSVTNSRWRLTVNSVTLFAGLLDIASMPAKGTKSVHWMFVDPVAGTAIAGVNQTPYSAGAISGLVIPAGQNFTRDIRIGSSNGSNTSASQMYHGSLEVISRAGLTQAQVLAIVQNMQTHHGI